MTEDIRKSGRKVIAVDFDRVIHGYSKSWHDGTIYDPPVENTKEAMMHLKSLGYYLIIHSARACDRIAGVTVEKGQWQEIMFYLHKHEIPYDKIWTEPGKPIAHIYLDDRAIRFFNWNQAIQDISHVLAQE